MVVALGVFCKLKNCWDDLGERSPKPTPSSLLPITIKLPIYTQSILFTVYLLLCFKNMKRHIVCLLVSINHLQFHIRFWICKANGKYVFYFLKSMIYYTAIMCSSSNYCLLTSSWLIAGSSGIKIQDDETGEVYSVDAHHITSACTMKIGRFKSLLLLIIMMYYLLYWIVTGDGNMASSDAQ